MKACSRVPPRPRVALSCLSRRASAPVSSAKALRQTELIKTNRRGWSRLQRANHKSSTCPALEGHGGPAARRRAPMGRRGLFRRARAKRVASTLTGVGWGGWGAAPEHAYDAPGNPKVVPVGAGNPGFTREAANALVSRRMQTGRFNHGAIFWTAAHVVGVPER